MAGTRRNFIKANAKVFGGCLLLLAIVPLFPLGTTVWQSFNVTCDTVRPFDEAGELTPELGAYFPDNLYVHGERCDSQVNSSDLAQLGGALALANEPLLWHGDGAGVAGDDLTIRITHLPSFNTLHILRAEKRGDSITVYGSKLVYDRSAERYSLGDTKTRVLSAKEVEAFLALYGDGVGGQWFSFPWDEALDGTRISMETSDADGYRLVSEQANRYQHLDDLTQFLFETLAWKGDAARV